MFAGGRKILGWKIHLQNCQKLSIIQLNRVIRVPLEEIYRLKI